MGALTVTVDETWIAGNKRHKRGTISFSTSYGTGGDTGLTAVAMGLDRVDLVEISQQADYNLEYVYASGNVLAFYFDYDGADGAAIQVPNGTNVAAALASIRFHATGS